MTAKKGTSLPKSGTLLPDLPSPSIGGEGEYAVVIAAALHTHFKDTHGATKTVMRWTMASERTVKNWLAGTKGPSGAHLLVLVRYSDAVLDGFLQLAGRERTGIEQELAATRKTVREISQLLSKLVSRREQTMSKRDLKKSSTTGQELTRRRSEWQGPAVS
jgi:hypothetical protein